MEQQTIQKTCKGKILVVDDSAYVSDLIKNTLESLDYEVQVAEDGASALSLYNKFHPDLVTLDFLMPVMDGYETLVKIMKLDKNANVLMISALDHESFIAQCITAGACGFVTKPLRASEIKLLIPTYIDSQVNKQIKLIFTLDSRSLENTINEFTGGNKTVQLDDISITKKEKPTHTVYPGTNIPLPEVKKSLEFQVPQNCSVYCSKFTNQLNGTLMTIIRNSDMEQIFDKPVDANDPMLIELFNIIDSKFISEIIRLTSLRIDKEIVAIFDNSMDSNLGEEVTVAKYSITNNDKTFQIETQLWTNLDVLSSRGRFV